MSKIWYCPNCGYEVTSRGRCHSCHERLVASDLPELEGGDDDDEVGYRLDGWADRDRGRLIERLNAAEILHRFEDDELVVAADDEARVDDIVAEVPATPDDGPGRDGYGGTGVPGEPDGEAEPPDEGLDEWVTSGVQLLADGARRLRQDPTDMYADADVAEASAAVFTVDMFYGADADTWAAVGRVTRRLLAALGSEEALEDEIRSQAAVLEKLLDPLIREAAEWRPTDQAHSGRDAGVDDAPEGAPATHEVEPAKVVAGADDDDGTAAWPGPDEGGGFEILADGEPVDPTVQSIDPMGEPIDVTFQSVDSAVDGVDGAVDPVDEAGDPGEDAEGADLSDEPSDETETIYELPEWLPEQRAELGILLEGAGITYEWEGDDLVVPADREADVESLFEQVYTPAGEEDGDDGEIRYRAIEELFAAADRLANDPTDEQRAADAAERIQEAVGPPPLGLDEVAWFRIMTQARLLSESIGADRDPSEIGEEAKSLRDLLRGIV